MKYAITLNQALVEARKIAYSKSPKASLLLDINLEKSRRGFLNILYVYLRWVDDIVDNPKISTEYKKKFLNRQRDLITFFCEDKEIELVIPEEIFLYYFIHHSKSVESPLLIEEVKNMIEAICWDLNRLEKDGIYSEVELKLYIDKMAKSLHNILTIFFLPPKSTFDPELYFGKFTANVQMLRDLIEDIDAGLINISREDIKKYNLKVADLKNDPKLKMWLKEKIPIIMKILLEETILLKKLSMRRKIFVYYTHIYYLPKIYRLKVYKFNLQKIKYYKSFVNEMMVYSFSLFKSLKLFIYDFLTPAKE